MVKINTKYYNKVNESPVEVQTLKNQNVEIYFLNNTPFYNDFIGKGRFFFWSTLGKDYRLFIEEGYYYEIKDLFTPKVNEIWINYYEESEKIRTKSFKKFLLPGLILYAIISFVALMWLKDYAIPVLLGCVVIMFIASRYFSKYLNREFGIKNNEAVAKIKLEIGKKEYNNLLKKSDKYRNSFYHFDDETPEEVDEEHEESTVETEENLVIPEDNKENTSDEIEEVIEAIDVVENKEEV